MTFIDASAIVAILAREAASNQLIGALEAASPPRMVTPLTIFEATVSLARAKLGPASSRKPTADEVRAAHMVVRAFVEANALEGTAITPTMADLAVEAAAVYGKAVGHPADLNFGDCFVYAAAKAKGARLLYKGDDFSKTDIA